MGSVYLARSVRWMRLEDMERAAVGVVDVVGDQDQRLPTLNVE